MVPFFTAFYHNEDTISDHAFIAANFSEPDNPRVVKWKPCKDLRSLNMDLRSHMMQETRCWDSLFEAIERGDLDLALREWTDQVEASFKHILRHAPDVAAKAFLGRSRPTLVNHPIHIPVVKTGRLNDPACKFDDAPAILRQQIRQIRRLHTVLGQLQSHSRGTESAGKAARETWDAVLRSGGFQGTYHAHVLKTFGIDLPHTVDTQSSPLVQLLYALHKERLTSLELALVKATRHRQQEFLEADWKTGGAKHSQELRPPPKPSITILEIPVPLRATRCRHDKTGPFFIIAPDFPSRAVWVEHHGCRRAVLEREGERIRLDGPLKANSAEVTILALVPTRDPTQLQGMTQQYWAKFWEAAPEVDLAQIQLILQDLPMVPPFNSEITVEEVTWGLKQIGSQEIEGAGPVVEL